MMVAEFNERAIGVKHLFVRVNPRLGTGVESGSRFA